MNEFPKMVYRAGGPHEIHGGMFDTAIVSDQDDQDEALAYGWHLTTAEAKTAAEAEKEAPAPEGAPTRKEMLQRAAELKIEHKHNISNAALAELIDAAEKA